MRRPKSMERNRAYLRNIEGPRWGSTAEVIYHCDSAPLSFFMLFLCRIMDMDCSGHLIRWEFAARDLLLVFFITISDEMRYVPHSITLSSTDSHHAYRWRQPSSSVRIRTQQEHYTAKNSKVECKNIAMTQHKQENNGKENELFILAVQSTTDRINNARNWNNYHLSVVLCSPEVNHLLSIFRLLFSFPKF